MCGPHRLRKHMAHFRDQWWPAESPLLFATLTLRPGDAERFTVPEHAHALRTLFSRVVRRIDYREGERPLYLAQVDLNDDREHPHLHAVVETNLDPSVVAGLWVAAGGGIDSDVRVVGDTPDDVARVTGYVVEACRWNTGRLLCSQGIGYNTAEAKAARQVAAQAASDEPPDVVFEPAEREPKERSAVPRPQFDLFTSVVDAPSGQVVPYPLHGQEYSVRRHYDPTGPFVLYTADRVDRSGRRPSYVTLGAPRSRRAAERFIKRYDIRRRRSQRLVR